MKPQRMAFYLTELGITKNKYFLSVIDGKVSLQSADGTPNALSNIFRDKAAELHYRLAESRVDSTSLKIIKDLLPRYLSGPNVGQITYTVEIFNA